VTQRHKRNTQQNFYIIQWREIIILLRPYYKLFIHNTQRYLYSVSGQVGSYRTQELHEYSSVFQINRNLYQR